MVTLFSSRAALYIFGDGVDCRADLLAGSVEFDADAFTFNTPLKSYRLSLKDIDRIQFTCLGIVFIHHASDVPDLVRIRGIGLERRLTKAIRQHHLEVQIPQSSAMGTMLRVVFWICVAVVLFAIGWYSKNSDHMTSHQNMVVCSMALGLVLTTFTSAGIGMLVYGARKGSIILGGTYLGIARAKEFSRNTQPIGYWLTMAFYVCWTFLCLFALCGGIRKLIQLASQ